MHIYLLYIHNLIQIEFEFYMPDRFYLNKIDNDLSN